MTVLINIDDLATRIAARLRKDDLWDAGDVAAYLKCERRTVLEYYAPMVGFPKAIRLPTNTGSKSASPRWRADQIKEWALAHQDGGKPTGGRPRKAA